MRPKTLQMANNIDAGSVIPSISGKINGMISRIIIAGNPRLMPSCMAITGVTAIVKPITAAKKLFSTSQTT